MKVDGPKNFGGEWSRIMMLQLAMVNYSLNIGEEQSIMLNNGQHWSIRIDHGQ